MPSKKRCSRCGRDLPLDAFHRHSSSSDGRKSDCRDCSRSSKAVLNVTADVHRAVKRAAELRGETIGEFVARAVRNELVRLYPHHAYLIGRGRHRA